MFLAVKLGDNSICTTCDTTPSQDQCVQCFTCKLWFHAHCVAVDNESSLATKTMVRTFAATSTKSNVKFFCDGCLTKLEINLVATEIQKITDLEKKVSNMENKLEEISNLLKSQSAKSSPKQGTKACAATSIWHDKDKLATAKAPASKSVLVIKSTDDTMQNENNQSKFSKPLWRKRSMFHNLTKIELVIWWLYVTHKKIEMN